MIKWTLEKLGIEISLDVQDCESSAVMQFKALIEPDLTPILKAEMAGLYRLRGGTIGESMVVDAIELRKALNHGLPQYRPKLIEGEDIYKAHTSKPFPHGVKP